MNKANLYEMGFENIIALIFTWILNPRIFGHTERAKSVSVIPLLLEFQKYWKPVIIAHDFYVYFPVIFKARLDFEKFRENRHAGSTRNIDVPGTVETIVVVSTIRIIEAGRRDDCIPVDFAAACDTRSFLIFNELVFFWPTGLAEVEKRVDDLKILCKFLNILLNKSLQFDSPSSWVLFMWNDIFNLVYL